jgi:hypothetical protein
MSNEGNIGKYTAAEIERYHSGQMSVKERHALEKAALDDPFLADALEGYGLATGQSSNDLADLGTRLTERIEGAKVVSMHKGGNRTKFPWLKVAAIVVLVAGAGLLANQFLFTKRSPLAKMDSENVQGSTNGQSPGKTDTSYATTYLQDTTPVSKNVIGVDSGTFKLETLNIRQAHTNAGMADSLSLNTSYFSTTTPPGQNTPGGYINSPKAPQIANQLKTDTILGRDVAKTPVIVQGNLDDYREARKTEISKKDVAVLKSADERDLAKTENRQDNYKSRAMSEKEKQNAFTDNYFRGRVVDANNNPVPFANITSTRDNAQTYADASGNFNFVSPDTVIDVQVRSLGYESYNTQLRNRADNNQVVLLDDKKGLAEIVLSNKKPNTTARAERGSIKIEGSEPADGWENYDTYLANNVKTPEELKTRQAAGEVELSFEVNKDGEPINIKVEKSLCSDCDKEAIRLLKDGPKWKKKAKKGRTNVKVAF